MRLFFFYMLYSCIAISYAQNKSLFYKQESPFFIAANCEEIYSVGVAISTSCSDSLLRNAIENFVALNKQKKISIKSIKPLSKFSQFLFCALLEADNEETAVDIVKFVNEFCEEYGVSKFAIVGSSAIEASESIYGIGVGSNAVSFCIKELDDKKEKRKLFEIPRIKMSNVDTCLLISWIMHSGNSPIIGIYEIFNPAPSSVRVSCIGVYGESESEILPLVLNSISNNETIQSLLISRFLQCWDSPSKMAELLLLGSHVLNDKGALHFPKIRCENNIDCTNKNMKCNKADYFVETLDSGKILCINHCNAVSESILAIESFGVKYAYATNKSNVLYDIFLSSYDSKIYMVDFLLSGGSINILFKGPNILFKIISSSDNHKDSLIFSFNSIDRWIKSIGVKSPRDFCAILSCESNKNCIDLSDMLSKLFYNSESDPESKMCKAFMDFSRKIKEVSYIENERNLFQNNSLQDLNRMSFVTVLQGQDQDIYITKKISKPSNNSLVYFIDKYTNIFCNTL